MAPQRGLESEAPLVEEEHPALRIGQIGRGDLSDFF
jgi:hypothetical protein